VDHAPDLIHPLAAFRGWQLSGGRLKSPWVEVYWTDPLVEATCLNPRIRGSSVPHTAPDPECRCGVYAYHSPRLRSFARIDVMGIVALWGQILVHHAGLRAQNARICALVHRPGWGGRHNRQTASIARDLGVDLVQYAELEEAARRYGTAVPPSLMPPEPPRAELADHIR
jgi:hypothetical protein